MDSKKYRLKYNDKWMDVKRYLGTYIYELSDDITNVKSISYEKAIRTLGLISEIYNLNANDIKIIECEK